MKNKVEGYGLNWGEDPGRTMQPTLKYKDFSKPNFSTDITLKKLFDVTKYHFDIFPVFWYNEMFWAHF